MLPRTLGEYALSPATAQAVLTLSRTRHDETTDWLFNLRTLIRNYVESYEEPKYYELSPSNLTFGLIEEIEKLRNVLAEVAPKINLRIYYPSYTGMKIKYPYALHREPVTPITKATAKQVDDLVKMTTGKYIVEKTDCMLPMITRDSYVTTHYVADLLGKKGYGQLLLLESYTGVVKTKDKWSSKLTGSARPEIANLPFNSLTVQLFGDQSVQFKSSPKKMKELILELAGKKNWTTLSTTDYIRVCLNSLTDPFAKKLYNDMLK